MRFGQRVTAADWSSTESRWTVTCETETGRATYTANFLYACTGYYDYENGHAPQWPGMEGFEGRIVYPQFWPDDLDYAKKRVVVIGSGATAVTLVPAMAERAAHVTMLQRSPTYIVALPSRDAIAETLRRYLPARVADDVVRWKNIAYSMFTYTLARKRPDRVRSLIRGGVLQALGAAYNSALHDVDVHFNPAYKPWDQRLCLVPDGDLFTSLASGAASVKTGRIATFLPNALRLESGEEVPADVVVSATGLTMQLFGGVAVSVDGEHVDLSKRLVYKGTLMEGMPNFAFSFGYTNASWTLKVDLNARYVGKLLRFMKKKRRASVTPVPTDAGIVREPLLGLSSGYVQRAASILPQQGPMPWRVFQNYVLDLIAYRTARFDDGTLRFTKKGK